MSIMDNANKVTGILAFSAMAGLLVAMGASFVISPHYKEGVELSMSVFKDIALFAGGAKAGLAISNSTNTHP